MEEHSREAGQQVQRAKRRVITAEVESKAEPCEPRQGLGSYSKEQGKPLRILGKKMNGSSWSYTCSWLGCSASGVIGTTVLESSWSYLIKLRLLVHTLQFLVL